LGSAYEEFATAQKKYLHNEVTAKQLRAYKNKFVEAAQKEGIVFTKAKSCKALRATGQVCHVALSKALVKVAILPSSAGAANLQANFRHCFPVTDEDFAFQHVAPLDGFACRTSEKCAAFSGF
jgi:hypothetical protein